MRRAVRHLGLIPDGGRRWARLHRVPLLEAYLVSMTKLEEGLNLFYGRGIEAVSLYMLSRWNLSRGPEHLDAVFEAEARFLELAVPRVSKTHDVAVKIVGDTAHLQGTGTFLECVQAAQTAYRQFPATASHHLFLCLAYDPIDELTAALRCAPIPTTGQELTSRLWVNQSLDLVIRTGGAKTLSHFLPIQAGYARLVFLEDLFNDMTAEALWAHVKEHERMELRFGS